MSPDRSGQAGENRAGTGGLVHGAFEVGDSVDYRVRRLGGAIVRRFWFPAVPQAEGVPLRTWRRERDAGEGGVLAGRLAAEKDIAIRLDLDPAGAAGVVVDREVILAPRPGGRGQREGQG